ncbi:radical SAM protein [Micromonospora sp. NPDC000207]|uniref:B12-binding domain-containing radical SAM protein n=1 Tax=Micromonospora sp. NPDC000207 TaxID=3154246 RepID=UPI0033312BED
MVNRTSPYALLLAPAYDHDVYRSAESLGLRAVAAVLRRLGAEVHVFDECAVPPPEVVRGLASHATLIGLGVLFTRQTPDAMDLARRLRLDAPKAHFTIGGQGLQFLWEEVMRDCAEIDSACMNEGDETIAELWDRLARGQGDHGIKGLCTRLDGKVVSAGPRPPVAALDDLPYAYRDPSPTAYRDGHATVSTSRGCAAHCTFCQSGNYGNRYHRLPRWRQRSARSVIGEVVRLHDGHGVDAVSFVDDDFLGGAGQGRDRAVEFADRLAGLPFRITFSIECRVDEIDGPLLERLRGVGLRHVLIGIESATESDIRIFAKRTTTEQVETAVALLRRLNIDFSTGFIMFQPLSTLAGITDNLAFLARNRLTSYSRLTNRLELYPGALLLRYFERHGVRMQTEKYRVYYEFTDPLVSRLYAAMRQVLAPFAEVEAACDTAKFRAARGHDEASFEHLATLRDRSDEIANCLIDYARRCLDQVCENGVGASFEHLTAAVARETSRMRQE